MINKKIMLSSVSIVAALSLVSAGAFAAFSSQATSSNNVFASGTVNLQLDDNDEVTPAASVIASIVGSNMAPGGTPESGFISVHNGGSLPMSGVNLRLDATVNQGGDGLGDIRNFLDLTVKTGDDNTCTTNSSDLTGAIATAIGDGFSPLTVGEFNGNTFTNVLAGLTPTSTKYVCVTTQLNASADNTIQGDSSNVTFTFTGNQ